VTPRPVGVHDLLHLIHLHRLAADGREELPAHIRIDDAGVSATIKTDDVLVMVRLGGEVETDDPVIAAVTASHISYAALRALDLSRQSRDEVAIQVADGQLRFVAGQRELVSVPLLDAEPVDYRRSLAELLMRHRVPVIGEYRERSIEVLRRIVGVEDLDLQALLPDDAEDLDDDALIERLTQQPAIHWSDRVLAVIQPRRAR